MIPARLEHSSQPGLSDGEKFQVFDCPDDKNPDKKRLAGDTFINPSAHATVAIRRVVDDAGDGRVKVLHATKTSRMKLFSLDTSNGTPAKMDCYTLGGYLQRQDLYQDAIEKGLVGTTSVPFLWSAHMSGPMVVNQRLLDPAAAGCFQRGREDPAMRGQLLPHQPLSSPASGSVVRGNTEAVAVKHESICNACRTSYSWDREGGDFYVRTQWELSSCLNPSDPKWLLLLDPRTWGADKDSETRGLLWCPVKGCATGSRWKEFVSIARRG